MTATPIPTNTIVVDIETSVVKKRNGEWGSMPWDVPADVEKDHSPHGILFGAKWLAPHGALESRIGPVLSDFEYGVNGSPGELVAPTIVGHNLKFDAAHAPFLRALNSWDTMIAEYILTAQQTKFASLSDLVKKYAPGMSKPDVIGENLANGIRPQDLPDEDLVAYLGNDLDVTAEVFKCQWALSTRTQRALILVQSAASLVYGEMEANGLTLDVATTIARRDDADGMSVARMTTATAVWANYVGRDAADAMRAGDAIMSPTALSMWFFGTPSSLEVIVPLTDAEKIGAPKHRKNRKVTVKAPHAAGVLPLCDPAACGSAKRAIGDIYGTSDEVLEQLKTRTGPEHSLMVSVIQQYRATQKLSKTYYTPWLETIEQTTDRCLHPKIHATATDTGRTSSSQPNGQNVPAEAKPCIVSRFEGGSILEVDFKQLEVCGLAEVSQCPALIKSLRNGDDIHFLSGQKVFGWKSPADMDKEKRRIVKTINFGLIYGGSAPTLAKQAGIDEATAKALIKSFYGRFPGVEDWQDDTYKRVSAAPDRTEVVPSPEGTTCVHWLTTLTGRSYAFPIERPPWAPTAAGRPSPTKVKNYPVQGFATGDIVPLATLLVAADQRRLYPDVKRLLVVHDSMLFDVPTVSTTSPGMVASGVRRVVEDQLPRALKDLWGIELSVPLSVDVTIHPTWK